MRETIEKKLGYSLDEYFDEIRRKMEYEKKMGWETEEEKVNHPELTISERFFLAEYAKNMTFA